MHRKKIIEKHRINKLSFIIIKINWMKIGFTTGTNFHENETRDKKNSRFNYELIKKKHCYFHLLIN